MESTAYNEGITELNAEFDEDVESDTDSESIEPDDEMEKEYNVSQLEEKSLVSRHFDFWNFWNPKVLGLIFEAP